MINDPQQMRAFVTDLTHAAWSLAAIGALLDSGLADALVEARTLDELAAGCRAFSARRIEKLVAVAAAHGVVVAEGERYRLADGAKQLLCGPLRAAVAGDIRSHLMQPIALLDSARAADAAWSQSDHVGCVRACRDAVRRALSFAGEGPAGAQAHLLGLDGRDLVALEKLESKTPIRIDDAAFALMVLMQALARLNQAGLPTTPE